MSQWRLPKGYVVWCHICARPPINAVTEIEGIKYPGVGFKTIEEASKHDKEYLVKHQSTNGDTV
jgi:hypothetical protein